MGNDKMTYGMKLLSPLALAAALATGGCATPDFRGTVSEAKDAVFPSLVYIRVVMKDLEGGKNEKAGRTRRRRPRARA